MNLGGIICFLLRGHRWRRLRKGENMPQDESGGTWRICTRWGCDALRLTKQRTRRTQGREAT